MTGTSESVCQICGRKFSRKQLVQAGFVRPSIAALIEKDHPGWSSEGLICSDDLNRYRSQYVYSLVEDERGELSSLEREVVESIARHEILATEVDEEYESKLTFGQRLSDGLARFGGSWTFIIAFIVVVLVWIALNSLTLITGKFDPYPYILLNLVLSCLAAIQAPVIIMSQNRQDARDRLRAKHDFQVNLKAELEIRHLHEKIDHLLSRQWERLVNIQEVQLELLSEIGKRK